MVCLFVFKVNLIARCIKIFIHYVGYLGISHPSVSWGFSFSSGCPNLSRQKLVKYRTLPTTCRKQVKKYCYLSRKKKKTLNNVRLWLTVLTIYFWMKLLEIIISLVKGARFWCVNKIPISECHLSHWVFPLNWIITIGCTLARLKKQKLVKNSCISLQFPISLLPFAARFSESCLYFTFIVSISLSPNHSFSFLPMFWEDFLQRSWKIGTGDTHVPST